MSPPRVAAHSTISDHFPVTSTLNESSLMSLPPPSRWIMDKRVLRSDKFLSGARDVLESANHISTIPELEETLCAITKLAKATQKKLKARLKKKRSRRERTAKTARDAYNSNPSEELLYASIRAQASYETEINTQRQEARLRATVSWDSGHELPSRFLTSVAHHESVSRNIESLSTADPNNPIPKHKCAEFIHEKFQGIYKKGNLDRNALNYFELADLPQVQPEHLPILSSPPTIDEVAKAIQHSPTGKSPGPDGIIADFYKRFVGLFCSNTTQVLYILLGIWS